MKFQQETSITGKNVVAGHNSKIHQVAAGAVTGLDVGHVVVILPTGLSGRWDGVPPVDGTSGAALPYRLAIVTRKQFDGDSSVTILAQGDYVRESCVLADGSALPAEAQFYLTLSGLWAEGEW